MDIHKLDSGMAEAGAGWAYAPSGFGRIEGAAGQPRRTALQLAHSDFQILRNPCKYTFSRQFTKYWFKEPQNYMRNATCEVGCISDTNFIWNS